MADSPVPRRQPSARLDRASLDRVLARAAELQGTGPDAGDSSEEFTEEQLIELGKEVGLSAQNLRQALAEERTRSIVPTDERGGVGSRIIGPGRVAAARTVSGKPADVLAAIDVWMQRQETLIVKRHFGDRMVWEPSRNFGVAIKRAFKPGGRDYPLASAHEVGATVLAVDDTRVHVALEADFSNLWRRSVGQIAGSTGVGAVVATSVWAIGLGTLVATAPLAVAVIGGVAISRAYHHRVVLRAQLALEQLLDRLERGEIGRRGSERLIDAIVAAATSLPPRRP